MEEPSLTQGGSTMKTMIYDNCRDGFDRAPEHKVNDTSSVAVPIGRGFSKESTFSRRINPARRSSAVRALVVASLCGLVAISASAVNEASNLKLSLNGANVVLSWTGVPGVLYQAQGATSLGGATAWQNIDAPTTS